MNWETVLKILEGASYVAALIVLVIAYKGLAQIKIARESLSLESKRDALRCSNDAITNFFDLILPKYEAEKNTAPERDLIKSLRLTNANKIDFEKISKKYKDEYSLNDEEGQKRYKLAIREAFEKKREVFNLIESFSSSFTSGLADEKVAYLALGQVFCLMLGSYETVLRHFNEEGYYRNTGTLYSLWKKRLMKEKVSLQVSELEDEVRTAQGELAEIKEEINNIEDKEIVSVGTASSR